MIFTPAPSNDFDEFIETYFQRCRERVPQIEGNAGKWTFEDLIPGLSDFDTRFFLSDSMTAADWCRMSTEVGQVHLDLVKEREDWARNLEHLPGVNLKWGELFDRQFYFTEFSQWSFYHGTPEKIAKARDYVSQHVWNTRDELYHWEKIVIYHGPYNRSIDPPINLGPYKNKYALHSRLMHYLAPPLQSAVCLMEKNTTPGKLDAMRRARSLFPLPETMDLVLDIIDRHYETPEYLEEPGITALDNRLEAYLNAAVDTILENGSVLDAATGAPTPVLKESVGRLRSSQESFRAAKLFESLKFSRLMKGRLWFYGQEVLWFDSQWLIRNELQRMRANFYENPLRLFARLRYGKDVDADGALELMRGDVLENEDIAACRYFAELAGKPCDASDLKRRALEIAALFDPFLYALEKIMWKLAA